MQSIVSPGDAVNQLSLFERAPIPTDAGFWDFAGQDTQYLTHGLHPYLASMIPQIPRTLIKRYMPKGGRLLDPFVGGGSVVVEAYLNGVESWGIDVNPLAILISKAKTTRLESDRLQGVATRLLEHSRTFGGPTLRFPKETLVDYWFHNYTFRPLTAIIQSIREISKAERGRDPEFGAALSTFLLCVFSNTVRDVSLTYRGEVRLHRLKPQDLDRFRPDVQRAFEDVIPTKSSAICAG